MGKESLLLTLCKDSFFQTCLTTFSMDGSMAFQRLNHRDLRIHREIVVFDILWPFIFQAKWE